MNTKGIIPRLYHDYLTILSFFCQIKYCRGSLLMLKYDTTILQHPIVNVMIWISKTFSLCYFSSSLPHLSLTDISACSTQPITTEWPFQTHFLTISNQSSAWNHQLLIFRRNASHRLSPCSPCLLSSFEPFSLKTTSSTKQNDVVRVYFKRWWV